MSIAIVTRSHASTGIIFVRMWSQGVKLGEVNDVDIDEPADNQILAYDETVGVWKNIDIPESAGIVASATPPEETTSIWFNTETGITYIYYDDFWTSIAGSSGAPIISDTPPVDPVLGTQWFNSSTGKSYLYYSDAWVEIDSNGTSEVSAGNAIINGGFEINQRNFTSTTSSGIFTFDRWQTFTEGLQTSTFSSQVFTPGAAPLAGYEATNYLRIVTADTSGTASQTRIQQRIEDVRTFAGQTVTFSFFARAGSGTPSIAVEALQSFGTGGTPSAVVTGSVATGTVIKRQISTLWARYSGVFTIPSIAGKTIGTTTNGHLQFNIVVNAGSAVDVRTDSLGLQNNTFDIWGVQLEAGAVATPFRRNAPSIQGELAACQRYYWRAGGDTLFQILSGETIVEGSTVLAGFINPSTMRITPTAIEFSTLMVYDGTSVISATNATLGLSGRYKSRANLTLASSPTANRPWWVMTNNSLAGFIGFSAEL
jgi:hypothetical protein